MGDILTFIVFAVAFVGGTLTVVLCMFALFAKITDDTWRFWE